MQKIKAYAKINLTLDVKNKREDGYHELATIMQTISLCDEVEVKKADEIIISCSNENVPLGEKNIAYKAAKLFFEKAGINGGADIYIDKKIPMQAGMAGGSTDAAAVLLALNEIYGNIFTENELCEMGAKIGADVPFCILGGTKAAYGIGEKLFDAPKMPSCKIVVVKPDANVNTGEAYGKIDAKLGQLTHKTDEMLKALSEKNLRKIGENLSNDFEAVSDFEDLSYVKDKMKNFNAYGTLMSGSGSAIYGLFDENNDDAEKCAEKLKEKYKENVFICVPV